MSETCLSEKIICQIKKPFQRILWFFSYFTAIEEVSRADNFLAYSPANLSSTIFKAIKEYPKYG